MDRTCCGCGCSADGSDVAGDSSLRLISIGCGMTIFMPSKVSRMSNKTAGSHFFGSFSDPCGPNPCLNNGQCSDVHGNAVCVCDTGFKGRYCHVKGRDAQ